MTTHRHPAIDRRIKELQLAVFGDPDPEADNPGLHEFVLNIHDDHLRTVDARLDSVEEALRPQDETVNACAPAPRWRVRFSVVARPTTRLVPRRFRRPVEVATTEVRHVATIYSLPISHETRRYNPTFEAPTRALLVELVANYLAERPAAERLTRIHRLVADAERNHNDGAAAHFYEDDFR